MYKLYIPPILTAICACLFIILASTNHMDIGFTFGWLWALFCIITIIEILVVHRKHLDEKSPESN